MPNGLDRQTIDHGGNLPGMIGPVIVIASDRLKRGVPAEGSRLAVIAAEAIKRRCNGCVAQAMRPGRDPCFTGELAIYGFLVVKYRLSCEFDISTSNIASQTKIF